MANLTHVVTSKVRLSYANVFVPRSNGDGPEKYSVLVLLPKSDTATKARIDAAIQAAKEAGKMTKFGGKLPPMLPTPIHDGDGVRPTDGEPYGPECKGCWVFTASNKNKPGVVDINCNPIIDQSEIYSGCYARVAVDFFAYANTNKKGIGCSLANVQKLADGEALGGRSTTAEEDFGAPATSDDDFF